MAFANGFKQRVHERFLQSARDRVDAFTDMIRELSADAQSDAKSSAGDKHETALSMMHLEQEKLNAKLSECLQQLRVLERIDPGQTHDRVHMGSLVQVNAMNVYIACALPKINVDGIDVIGISAEAPLAAAMLGLPAGDEFLFKGGEFVVKKVV